MLPAPPWMMRRGLTAGAVGFWHLYSITKGLRFIHSANGWVCLLLTAVGMKCGRHPSSGDGRLRNERVMLILSERPGRNSRDHLFLASHLRPSIARPPRTSSVVTMALTVSCTRRIIQLMITLELHHGIELRVWRSKKDFLGTVEDTEY